MKHDNSIYNDLLNKLKQTEPQLDNSEKLTDDIMQKISQTILYKQKSGFMHILGTISGVAASIFICLFIYEMIRFPISDAGMYNSKYAVKSDVQRNIQTKSRKRDYKDIESRIRNRKLQKTERERLISYYEEKYLSKNR